MSLSLLLTALAAVLIVGTAAVILVQRALRRRRMDAGALRRRRSRAHQYAWDMVMRRPRQRRLTDARERPSDDA